MCISSKTSEHFGLDALLWLSMHNRGNVCSTNSSVSNDVPVPLVCPPQGEGWKGQRRKSSGGRLGFQWMDPKELPLYQLIPYRMRNKTTLRRVEVKDLGTFD